MTQLHDVNTLEEAAAYLRLTPRKLRELARSKRIGSLKEGRSWLFTREVITTYLKGNTQEQAAPNPWGLTDASARRLRAGHR